MDDVTHEDDMEPAANQPPVGQQSSPTPDMDVEDDMQPYGSGTEEVLRKLGAGQTYKGTK